MKKKIIVTAVICLTLIITACGRPEQRIAPTSPDERTAQTEPEAERDEPLQESSEPQADYSMETNDQNPEGV